MKFATFYKAGYLDINSGVFNTIEEAFNDLEELNILFGEGTYRVGEISE